MKQVRAAFYGKLPERAWFTQQERVKAALTLPAKWLDDRKVELPAERYEAVLRGILSAILARGRRDLGPYPCAYLWSCVESHMAHHGDKYYEEGKSVRNALERALQPRAVLVVSTFAQVHDAVSTGRRKPKSKAPAAVLQEDFFAPATAPKIAKVRAPMASKAPFPAKVPARVPGRSPAT